MEGHAKKCVERYCELATEQFNSYTKSQLHALTNINLGKEKWDALENGKSSLTNCSWIVCTWRALEDQAFYGPWTSLHVLSPKGPEACDTCSARLISYIHHTSEFKQYCHVGNTAPECRLRLFQDWFCREILKTQKSTSGGLMCIYGSHHTFVPISLDLQETNICLTQFNWSWDSFSWCKVYTWMRFHFLIFENWLLKCFILHLTNKRNPKTEYRETCCVTPIKQAHPQTKPKFQSSHDTLELSNVDYVSSNANSSQFGAMLQIFEDKEAVIKMIIKSRKSNNETRIQNPQSCSWVVVWQNQSGSKIQIKYVDTKHQLADMLNKGKFHTWWVNNLLLLCSISHFSSFACAQNFSSSSCPETDGEKDARKTMEKRGLWHSPRRRGAQRLHACRRKIWNLEARM